MAVKDRVKIRIPEITDPLLDEFAQTAIDRINLRVGVTLLPVELESVAVDVVCAMYNRKYHEGIKTEGADIFSVTFVDNILKEFEEDFKLYKEAADKQANEERGVFRFI